MARKLPNRGDRPRRPVPTAELVWACMPKADHSANCEACAEPIGRGQECYAPVGLSAFRGAHRRLCRWCGKTLTETRADDGAGDTIDRT
jgi:hypothetical protein